MSGPPGHGPARAGRSARGRGAAALRLSRRRFLRGVGGATIALPPLLGQVGDTRAEPPAPSRLFTVFFGNGLPPELADEGLAPGSVLAPLAAHAGHLAVVRGLRCHATGYGESHDWGALGFACGLDAPQAHSKGGPSLEFIAQQVHEGLSTAAGAPGATSPPPGRARSVLCTAIFSPTRSTNPVRWIHSWRGVGLPNPPVTDALLLLERLFGPAPGGPGGDDAALARARARARLRHSLLDAVTGEYRRAASEAAGYPPAVRAQLALHLETLRELERRAQAAALAFDAPPTTAAPVECARPALAGGLDGRAPARMDGGAQGWQAAWEQLVSIALLAIRCDLVRFGSFTVLGAGEAFPYRGPEGAFDNVHPDVFHQWPRAHGPAARRLVTWSFERIATLLDGLADPRHPDAGGRTVLDGSTVLIGSELGDPGAHRLDDLSFLVAGGQVAPGVLRAPGRADVDLYSGLVRRADGSLMPVGDPRRRTTPLPVLRGSG